MALFYDGYDYYEWLSNIKKLTEKKSLFYRLKEIFYGTNTRRFN